MSSIRQDAPQEDARVWERLGPISSGGTVFGLAISPVDDMPRYWAATGCGVFYSDDGGDKWVQSLTGLTTPLLSALAVAPNGALFAGALGGDLFSSFDFGRSWDPGLVPSEYRATVTVLVASPNFSADGTIFAATDGGGVLVTRSSGNAWEDSSFGLGSDTVLALATSPDWSRREIMYAATLDGVFVSPNGGRAWRETELMLDDDVVDILVVSPAFDEDRTVYAGTEGGALYRSKDEGRTWDLLNSAVGEGPINCLWAPPALAHSGRIVAGVGRAIHVSNDGGESWQMAAQVPGSVLTLTGDKQVVLAGMHDAGIWKSIDGGENWSSASQGLAARGFARLISSGERFYALGPQEGLWISDDHGQDWGAVGDVSTLLPISATAVSSQGDLFVISEGDGLLLSADQGQSWSVVCDKPGLQALVLLPDSNKGWAGTISGELLASQDGGQSWAATDSPCQGQEILSIVASPDFGADHTLFMGTAIPATGSKLARVALWRSTNGGEAWRQLTTQVTPARWIDIAMPKGVDKAAEQAAVATGPYCLRPLRRATDVWISTTVDPNEANVLSVVVLGEIDQGGKLFAATGSGIFSSADGGRTWQPFSGGLGATSFISLVARHEGEQDVLYALSLGGIVWRREID